MSHRVEKLMQHLKHRHDVGEENLASGLGTHGVAGIRMGGIDFKEIARRVESWNKYLFEVVPTKLDAIRKEIRTKQSPSEFTWANRTYDAVVLGFGAAGASAALDLADAGKKVLLIDRFDGGGSTRRSGGVIYCGGGTKAQKEVGVDDSVDHMFEYIKRENNGAVDDAVIRDFCETSPAVFSWLEDRVKVPFKNENGERVHFQKKVSYPPSEATLYVSGNEQTVPCERIAKAAPRGNRVFGDYLTGNILFGAFEKAVEAHENITVALHTRAEELILENGSCKGVRVCALPDSLTWGDVEGIHVMLHEIGSGSPMFDPRRVMDTTCRKHENTLFQEFGVSIQLHTDAVLVSCGGFYFNQEMIQQYAPKFNGFMPLGNLGDDGSGINMALQAGIKIDRMDRCSAWKFVNPPYSFVRGILTNKDGQRAGDESVYGASFADHLIRNHDGKGWLLIDQKMWEEANNDCLDPASGLQEDQRMQGLANLHKNLKSGNTLQDLAEKTGMNVEILTATVAKYNQSAKAGHDEEFEKKAPYLEALTEAPFHAINLDMTGNKYWPTPCMTLGGIVVEGISGRAISQATNQPIPGLYAAGRSAVGIASNLYISGLSIADCIYTGKRAAKHIIQK